MSHIILPPELEERISALARAAGAELADVLRRLVEHALEHGEGLAAGADLPREIVLVKLHDAAHAGGQHAAAAAALLDELDETEFDAEDRNLAEELGELFQAADEELARERAADLIEYLRTQLYRDFKKGPSA